MTTISFTLSKIPLHTNITLLCCLDTGCGVILVDRTWLFDKAPIEKILKIATLLKVKSIKTLRHESNKFVSMSLYFLGIDSTNRPAYAHIHRKLYLVNGFNAHLLVGNNILTRKRVVINLTNKSALISSYQVTISVTAKSWGRSV